MAASAANIQSFLEFTGVGDRNVAVNYVNHHENDYMSAVQDYFDNGGDVTKYAFPMPVSSDWAGHRIGPRNQMEAAPPLELPANTWDEITPLGHSRPPSRVGGAFGSGMEGQTMGVTGEDDDMQRAMEMSLQDAPGGGVLRTIVAIDVPDPDPQERQRAAGAPAFLKPLARTHIELLSAFLTIAHSIPQCRETLLSLDDVQPQYPLRENWWQGEDGGVSCVVSVHESVETEGKEILHETQRLMAFLDGTTRAYGSAEIVSKLLGPSDGPPPLQADAAELIRFFLQFEEASSSGVVNDDGNEPAPSLFRSQIVKQGLDHPVYPVLLELAEVLSLQPDASLYDALDTEFYGRGDGPPFLFSQVAPVLLLSLPYRGYGPNQQGIPAELYVERYLEENAEQVAKIRAFRAKMIEQMSSIEGKIEKLSTFQHQRTTARVTGCSEKLYGTVKEYMQASIYEVGPGRLSVEDKTKRQDVLNQLEAISEHIHKRVEALNTEKAACEEELAQLRRAYTDPDFAPAPPDQESKYLLQGVAVMQDNQQSEVFVRRMTLLGEEQWWQMSYLVENGDARAMSREVTQAEVLQVAATSRCHTLLVYVLPDIMETPQVPLPQPLQDFVKRDNAAFALELANSRRYINPSELERQTENWGPPLTWEEAPPGPTAWQEDPRDTTSDPPPYIDTQHQAEPFPTVHGIVGFDTSDSDEGETGGVQLVEHMDVSGGPSDEQIAAAGAEPGSTAATTTQMDLDSQPPAYAPTTQPHASDEKSTDVSMPDVSAASTGPDSPGKRKSVDRVPMSMEGRVLGQEQGQGGEREGKEAGQQMQSRTQEMVQVERASPLKKARRGEGGE